MRPLFIALFVGLCIHAHAQISHSVNTAGLPVVDFVAGIDSIVFDPVNQEMTVIKSNSTQSIALAEVVNVTFSGSLNPAQSSCGADSVHNPSELINYGVLVDQDQHVYRTLILGPYEIMAENLNTAHYRNGDPILHAVDNSVWSDLHLDSTGAWAYYDNNPAMECPYGKLYNWYAVADPRGICPLGWHVPSEAEWSDFITYFGVGSAIAGGPMKSTGYLYWEFPNQGAINERGFAALPGGLRNGNGNFSQLRNKAYWWLINEAGALLGTYSSVSFDDVELATYSANKRVGKSVRCMRD